MHWAQLKRYDFIIFVKYDLFSLLTTPDLLKNVKFINLIMSTMSQMLKNVKK